VSCAVFLDHRNRQTGEHSSGVASRRLRSAAAYRRLRAKLCCGHQFTPGILGPDGLNGPLVRNSPDGSEHCGFLRRAIASPFRRKTRHRQECK